MARVKFKRFSSDGDLANVSIEDGSFIVTKDGTSYIDFSNERVPFGGTSDTEMSDTSVNSVQNKVVKSYVDDVKADVQTAQTDISNLQTFSTAETVIGTWINNKPLYRKVLSGNLPTGSGDNTFSISNSGIVSVNGFVKSSYGQWWSINTYFSENKYNISCRLNGNRNEITLVCGSFYNTNSQYILIVEYTKTTD